MVFHSVFITQLTREKEKNVLWMWHSGFDCDIPEMSEFRSTLKRDQETEVVQL